MADAGDPIHAFYQGHYASGASPWRELGGRYKAANLIRVCAGRSFARVLDCGAGEGSVLQHLDREGPFAELYAVEVSESGVEQIRKRSLERLVEARAFDGRSIPYPDDSFDLAFCSHVLEHVEHPRLLLRELARVSRFQALEVPLDYDLDLDRRAEAMLRIGHLHAFTPATVRLLLRSEGFEVLEELLTHTADEVIRFDWSRNQGLRIGPVRELKLRLRPLARLARRLAWGRAGFRERGFTAYTCLTRGSGKPRVGAGAG